MLHRVSTKKLRFRNRVRDFIRPHFERSAFPRRSERRRNIFVYKGFRPFAVLRVTRGGEVSY